MHMDSSAPGIHRGLSYYYRAGETPLSEQCIGAAFDATAARRPGALALVSRHQGARFTFAELQAKVDALARGLLRLGNGRGTRISLWSTNCVEWVVSQLAAARIGSVLVSLNPAYRADELRYMLKNSGSRTLIMAPGFRDCDYLSTLAGICPEVQDSLPGGLSSASFPCLRNLVLMDEPHRAASFPCAFRWSDVVAMGEQVPIEELALSSRELTAQDAINIQYTSGTTGRPKGAVLSHRNLVNNAILAAQAMGIGSQDRICVPVPFYHCFGMVLGNLVSAVTGAAVVIPNPHFDAEATLEAIQEEGCTAIYGVPTMYIREMEHPGFARFDLRSLRTGSIGGTYCSPRIVDRIKEKMHCTELAVGYGLTEASPIVTKTTMADPPHLRSGTVGKPLPFTEVKIVSAQTREIVPHGVEGELCVRGYCVMQGYYHDEEATLAAIDGDGWLRTGDMATLDEEGYCRIVGRLKDTIIRGGEKIHPREVEDFLLTHPGILEVQVVGVPDRVYGETVAAWVKLASGGSLTTEEVVAYCKGKIAAYKIPKHVRIVEDFPTTVTGKIQKYRIREIAGHELGLSPGLPVAPMA